MGATNLLFCVLIIIIILLIIIDLTSSASIVDKKDSCPIIKNKCTDKDPRQISTRCILYSVDKSLYCDRTQFRRIPDPSEIHVLPIYSCRNATALYINDSCLEGLKQSDMRKYQNISVFMCGRNYIKKLDEELFVFNKRLQKIDFCTNQIDEISDKAFKGLSQLKVLNLANNKISDLGQLKFGDLENLEDLSLHNNQIAGIKDYAFTGLWSLKVLKLTGNRLHQIKAKSFIHLTTLTHLHLDDNKLTMIAPGHFDHLKSLQVLTLSYNSIKVWNQHDLPELHTLNIGNNHIEVIESSDIANLSKLQNFSLENNSLSTLPEDIFDKTPNLRYLDLSANYLKNLGRTTFSGLCRLETLVVRDNALSTLHPDWFRNILLNDEDEGTDLGGNKWRCDCKVMQYLNLLEKVGNGEIKILSREKWLQMMTVTCDSPNSLENRELNTDIRYLLDCDKTDEIFDPSNEFACDPYPNFTRQTNPYKYSTRLETHFEVTTHVSEPISTTDAETEGVTQTENTFIKMGKQNSPDDGAAIPIIYTLIVIILIFLVLLALRRKIAKFFRREKGRNIDEDVERIDEKPLQSYQIGHRHSRDYEIISRLDSGSYEPVEPNSSIHVSPISETNGKYTSMTFPHENSENNDESNTLLSPASTIIESAQADNDAPREPNNEIREDFKAPDSSPCAEGRRPEPDGVSLGASTNSSSTNPKRLSVNSVSDSESESKC